MVCPAPQAVDHDRSLPLGQGLPPGVLVELSGQRGTACTTAAAALVRQAQQRDETTAWLQPNGGNLYPPDLHRAGIDLEALVVVHVPRSRELHAQLAKAGEVLLRSGAYGLLVLDLRGDVDPRWATQTAWQSRLWALARQHRSWVILLSQKPSYADSLGPLVGVRLEPRRLRDRPGTFRLEYHLLKNKTGLDQPATERYQGPPGLR